MTVLDDLLEVVRLAMLTEDRSDREQDALLRTCARIEAEANRDTVTNRRKGRAIRVYRPAEATRVLTDDDRPRLKAKVAAKLDAAAERWEAARC